MPVLLAVAVVACGGKKDVEGEDPTLEYAVTGSVSFGTPVSAADVSAYELNAKGERGRLLGQGKTDDKGAFTFTTEPYGGPLLLVVTGGSFLEPAVAGVSARLDNVEVTALLPRYVITSTEPGPRRINVTPVSHWAAAAVQRRAAGGQDLAAADTEVWQHFTTHFTVDWRTVLPRDVTVEGGTAYDEQARAGLVAAGLSAQALLLAQRAGLSPGGPTNTVSLTLALADDIRADGFFDGVGAAGALVMPPGGSTTSGAIALDGQAVRVALARGIDSFIGSVRNKSGVTANDALLLRNSVSANADPFLFKSGGSNADSLPPQVWLQGAPPARYTQADKVSFAVTADDVGGVGVKAVYARNGTGTPIAGVLSAGAWRFDGAAAVPLNPGDNRIRVWAEDSLVPPNSGREMDQPYSLEVLITRANSVAQPGPDNSFVSYRDERGLGFERDPSGYPVMPPRYTYPQGKVGAHLGVHKAGTRLSWGSTAPTAAELEGENAFNIPTLRFVVASPPGSAPVKSVSFKAALSCQGCSFEPVTGSLLPGTAPEGASAWLLPLAAESIPALAQLSVSTVTLSLTVTATDEAGNTKESLPVGFNFTVHGAPVAVSVDDDYPNRRTSDSVFAYRLEDFTYANAPQLARMRRIVIRNPAPVPVPVRVALENAKYMGWESYANRHIKLQAPYYDGNIYFTHDQLWWVSGANPMNDDYRFPCASMSTEYPYHSPGGQKFACGSLQYLPVESHRESAITPEYHVDLRLQVLNSGAGGDGAPAATWAEGYWVPAAQGTAAGEIALYVQRFKYENDWSGRVVDLGDGAKYQSWNMDFWRDSGVTYDCLNASNQPFKCRYFYGYRHAFTLTGAREAYTGAVSLATGARTGTGAVTGVLRELPSASLSFQRSF